MIGKLKIYTVFILVFFSILFAVFARGLVLSLFFAPILFSFHYLLNGRVVLSKREGNIIAGIFVVVFIPLFFRMDVFIMSLYFMLGLLIIKLFVSSEPKDFDQVSILSFLIMSLATIFLYSMWFLLLSFTYMFFLTLYLVLRIMPEKSDKEEIRAVRVLYSVPLLETLALILFFMLPRNPYQLFNYSVGEKGVNFDRVVVGGFENSRFGESTLLRVVPQDGFTDHIYLRTRVFTHFDGREWTSKKKWYKRTNSEVIRITYNLSKTKRFVLLPASSFVYVPMCDYPVALTWQGGRFLLNSEDYEVRVYGAFPKSRKYTVFSVDRPPVPLKVDTGKIDYTEVPDSIRGALIKTLKDIHFSNDTLISIIAYLQGHHSYGPFKSNDTTKFPILDFLKDGKRGECGEFATAFLMFARLLGYKTRLVAGFLTNEYNPIGKYFTVREKYAHVWPEVFLKGRWIRYDPTPPIHEKSFLNTLSEYYDYLQYIWFSNVVEYNYNDQMRLVIKAMPYFRKLKLRIRLRFIYKSIILFAFFSIFIVYYLVRLYSVPYETRAVKKFIGFMRKKGYKLQRGETLLELAERSGIKEAKAFVEEYYSIKYGNKQSLNALKNKLLSLLKHSF